MPKGDAFWIAILLSILSPSMMQGCTTKETEESLLEEAARLEHELEKRIAEKRRSV